MHNIPMTTVMYCSNTHWIRMMIKTIYGEGGAASTHHPVSLSIYFNCDSLVWQVSYLLTSNILLEPDTRSLGDLSFSGVHLIIYLIPYHLFIQTMWLASSPENTGGWTHWVFFLVASKLEMTFRHKTTPVIASIANQQSNKTSTLEYKLL